MYYQNLSLILIKREIYHFTEKLSREWSITIHGFKNYKNLSKLFKLSDSKNAQLRLSIVLITILLQNISVTTYLFHGNLKLLVLVLFHGKLVRILFHDLHDLVWFLHKHMATYRM